MVVVIFLCGVQVGRGARDGAGGRSRPTRCVAAAAPAAADADEPAPPAAEPPPPPAAGAEPDDDCSYAKRLQATDAGDGRSRKRASRSPRQAHRPAARRRGRQPKPAAGGAGAGAGAEPAPPRGRRGSSDRWPSGPWVVQLIATRDRDVAAASSQRLVGKGYPAFLVEPAAGRARRLQGAGRAATTIAARPSRCRSASRRKNSSSPGFRASAPLGRAARTQLSEVRPSRRAPGSR